MSKYKPIQKNSLALKYGMVQENNLNIKYFEKLQKNKINRQNSTNIVNSISLKNLFFI